ncbi:MAG: cell wall metabolism sensor histidine kinase WalK [Treponema sp.]|nr:cell wall metabolism sensor histidine kinase WalK [Treponema sp.]
MIQHKSLPIWVFLFLVNGLVLCAGFLVLLGQNLNALRNTAQDQTEENLRTFADAMVPLVVQHTDDIDSFVKRIASHNPDFRITLINSAGIVTGDSDAPDITKLENHGMRKEVKAALSGYEGKAVRKSTVTKNDVMYYAVPVAINNNKYALRLSMPVYTSVYFSSNVRRTMEATGLVVLIAILIASFLVSAYIVHRINDLRKAAGKYRAGSLEYEPAVHSPRELQELGEAMNSMAKEIRKNISDISEKRDEFKAVFSGITEGLIVFDKSMNVVEYNGAASQMFSAADMHASPFSLASFVYTADILSLAQKAVKGDELSSDGIETEVRSLTAERSLLVRCVKIAQEQSGERYLLIFSDITHLKKLEQVRRDFVANVSHELKTPVTSIKGFSETLLDGALLDRDTTRHFLEIIDSQSGRLMNIIEDLLTLSRLEQDSRLPDMIPSDIVEATRETCESFMHAAEEKEITVSFASEPEKMQVLMNAGLYQQAVGNIIDNAVKYCPAGSYINCSIARKADASGKLFAEIIVQDTGQGIPPQFRGRIFERFFRVDKGRSREAGGTGLGLSITSHIIQIHGGTVCETGRTDGKSGARFVIMLPEYHL